MSAASPPSPPDRNREYVLDLLQTEIDDGTLPPAIRDLLANDYALANIDGGDREYFRLLADNIAMYSMETSPPEGSWADGELGAALYDDPNYSTKPLNQHTRIRLSTALMDHFARSSRGVSGWQQDKFSETIQTSRLEDNSEPEESNTIFGGLFK